MKKVWLLPMLFVLIINCKLSAQSASALPVTISLDASLVAGNKVNVSWTIFSKLNTDYYNAEKSNDGLSWKSICVTKCDSNMSFPHTYTAVDLLPVKGVNFYRITIKDLNGRLTVTPVKIVRANLAADVALYPNPVAGTLYILPGQALPSDWSVSLISSQGQIILQKKYSKHTSSAQLPVNDIPPGIYLLEIINGDSKQVKKLLINHN